MPWISVLFGITTFGLIALWVLWISIRAIVRAIKPWRSRSGKPECAKCRYNVAGLTSPVCPECGSNLLEVGILGSLGVEPVADVLGKAVLGCSYIATWVLIAVAIVLNGFTPRTIWILWVILAFYILEISVVVLLRRIVRSHAARTAHQNAETFAHTVLSPVPGSSNSR